MAGSGAAPERARWPRLAAAPHPRLRGLLPRGYAGFTEVTTSRHLVLPATTSVPLVVKLLDSPYRPAAFVVGAHDSALVVEAAYAPSYMEVLLAPLGAYRLLGLPVDKLSGQIVDLVDVFGPAGRRLAEQLRQAPNWRRRFALLDRFLLGRLERGPQPSPEVGWAWARLVATHGAVPIGRLASEVGWSHKHLIARFRQQVGLRPKTAARLVRLDGVWRRLDQARGRLDWGEVAREAGYADQASSLAPPRPSSRPGRPRPLGTATRRSIPFKTRPRPLRSLADGARILIQRKTSLSMRAVTIPRFGDADVLTLTDVPTPTPGPGEVAIDRAVALGHGPCAVRSTPFSPAGSGSTFATSCLWPMPPKPTVASVRPQHWQARPGRIAAA